MEGTAHEHAVPDSNIGSRILKKMGWNGGSVGVDKQKVIVRPYCDAAFQPSHSTRRAGFGTSKQAVPFVQSFHDLLYRFLQSSHENDLIFSSEEFAEDDSQKIKHEATSKGLRVSEWNGCIILSRHTRLSDLVDYIEHCGGETCQYLLMESTGLLHCNFFL